MRILFAGDEQPYSAYALKEVVQTGHEHLGGRDPVGGPSASGSRPGPPVAPVPSSGPQRYREDFLNSWEGEGSPYALNNWQYEWLPLRDGRWEERLVCRSSKKDFKVRLRTGT